MAEEHNGGEVPSAAVRPQLFSAQPVTADSISMLGAMSASRGRRPSPNRRRHWGVVAGVITLAAIAGLLVLQRTANVAEPEALNHPVQAGSVVTTAVRPAVTKNFGAESSPSATEPADIVADEPSVTTPQVLSAAIPTQSQVTNTGQALAEKTEKNLAAKASPSRVATNEKSEKAPEAALSGNPMLALAAPAADSPARPKDAAISGGRAKAASKPEASSKKSNAKAKSTTDPDVLLLEALVRVGRNEELRDQKAASDKAKAQQIRP